MLSMFRQRTGADGDAQQRTAAEQVTFDVSQRAVMLVESIVVRPCFLRHGRRRPREPVGRAK